ncbi:type II secretion system protein [Sedimentibacter sp.]|uniref:PilW family protein n=1 Tax=Sedimentibacter sp. TaxID=1960295 RepID=UPI0028AAD8E7|nr:type II secretion system protein [Sedimentibacter sp.]
MKCKNGYTLVELLITLAIVAFVSVLIMTFFTANLNNIAKIKNNSELQFHAQYILNFFSEKIMESEKVELILVLAGPYLNSVINSKNEQSISKISLRYSEQANQCYIFEVRGIKIFYGKGKSNDSASSELGTYVKEIKIKPYPDGKTFAEAVGLRITVVLVKGSEEYDASQLIYMRLS